MKAWIYKNGKEELEVISKIIAFGQQNNVDKHHNADGSGYFSTCPEFGTISWAIEQAKKMQKRAIVAYNKGLKKSSQNINPLILKGFCDNVTMPNMFEKGYTVMTENEYKYWIGLITKEQSETMVEFKGKKKILAFTGRKFIVALDFNPVSNSFSLVPLR